MLFLLYLSSCELILVLRIVDYVLLLCTSLAYMLTNWSPKNLIATKPIMWFLCMMQ